MKKIGVLFFSVLFLLTLPAVAFGLTGPGVSEGRGEIGGMFISDDVGLQIGATYGINDDFGVFLQVGERDYSKLGMIYQLNPNVAIEGGMLSSEAFIGVVGATTLNNQLQGLGELNLYMVNDKFALGYEAGVSYVIKKNLDLRGGILGSTAGDGFLFEMGVGYHF